MGRQGPSWAELQWAPWALTSRAVMGPCALMGWDNPGLHVASPIDGPSWTIMGHNFPRDPHGLAPNVPLWALIGRALMGGHSWATWALMG